MAVHPFTAYPFKITVLKTYLSNFLTRTYVKGGIVFNPFFIF